MLLLLLLRESIKKNGCCKSSGVRFSPSTGPELRHLLLLSHNLQCPHVHGGNIDSNLPSSDPPQGKCRGVRTSTLKTTLLVDLALNVDLNTIIRFYSSWWVFVGVWNEGIA